MRQILVFGSNQCGHHAKGTALHALTKYGAVFGKGEGLQGDSYAIPVSDDAMNPLPLHVVAASVRKFLDFAATCSSLSFRITPIGIEDGSFTPEQVAPLFADAPFNCDLPYAFLAAQQGYTVSDLYAETNQALNEVSRMVQTYVRDTGTAIPHLAGKSEALCLMMMTCLDLLREGEGDDFVRGWLSAATRDIDSKNVVVKVATE